MTQFRIMDNNLVFSSATTLTASSSDANFPVSNIPKYFRSKVWRSNATGTFVISSANNKIDFTYAGPTWSATVASGTYTATTLATAIASAMNTAAATSAFSVSKSLSTGLWTITSSGPAIVLLFGSGGSVANSIGPTIGFAVADTASATTQTGSLVAIHTEESIVFDMVTTEGVDSVALVFDPTDGPQFTSAAVLTIQANATNVWTSPAVSQVLTLDTTYDVATHFFTSTQSYRYWRLKIVDPKNPDLYVEVSKVFLSLATQLSQNPEKGFGGAATDRSKISETDYGHRYADIYPRLRSESFNYVNCTGADLATFDAIHARLGNVVPLCVALDPTAVTWDKDRFFIFGYLNPGLSYKQSFYDYFDFSFTIEERA